MRAEHHELGVFYLYAPPEATLLFCENETNMPRVFGAEPQTRFPRDGIGDHVLHGAETVNPEGTGTKAAAHVRLSVPGRGQAVVQVRLTRSEPAQLSEPFAEAPRRGSRNESWFHMFNHDVVSMPDKWEYPWYAAWDLAFHCIPLAMVDPEFAKSQIDLMLSQDYLHPTGQLPAW